jgi:hypothetical protein
MGSTATKKTKGRGCQYSQASVKHSCLFPSLTRTCWLVFQCTPGHVGANAGKVQLITQAFPFTGLIRPVPLRTRVSLRGARSPGKFQ